jgi:ABC-type amino acid transport substrate-binding protein
MARVGRHRCRTSPRIGETGFAARSARADQLRGGWYPWDPYQYRDYRRGVPFLTSFDVEIERALARILGVEILIPEMAWDDHLAALAAGTADIAAGATASEARRAYAYFSKPYRSETDVLILRNGAAGRYPFRTIDGMLYPEIATIWGLAFAIFLEWEGERLQPEEIRLGVIVTLLTRMVAIVRGAKGWSYA